MQAILALEDGRIFRGEGYGHPGECQGEVVFNTSLTGYQEIATDPSYAGQIVVLTNPQIGNYGTNQADNEATKTANHLPYAPPATSDIAASSSRIPRISVTHPQPLRLAKM